MRGGKNKGRKRRKRRRDKDGEGIYRREEKKNKERKIRR
jgi:hypothetical protein